MQIPPYVVIMRAATHGEVPFSRTAAINPGRERRSEIIGRERCGSPRFFLITR